MWTGPLGGIAGLADLEDNRNRIGRARGELLMYPDEANLRSLVPGRVSPSSEEPDPDEPTRSPLPRLPVRDTEVISDR